MNNLNQVNQLLEQNLQPYMADLPKLSGSVGVLKSEIESEHPNTDSEVAKFYLYVGCNAVINDIKVLNSQQMKNSLGFKEITQLLKTVFEGSNARELVPTIEDSSKVFNTIYSEGIIKSFSDDQWSTHIQADINSVYNLLTKEQPKDAAKVNLEAFYAKQGQSNDLFRYGVLVKNVLEFLRAEYETTYQLIKPKGIIVPSEDDSNPYSLLSLKGSDGNIDTSNSFSILFRQVSKVLSKRFNLSDDVQIDLTHDTFAPGAVIKSPKRVFFVKPHLKLLFGRNLNSEVNNFQTPLGKRKYPTWSSAEDDTKYFLEDAFQRTVIYYFRNFGKNFYDIDQPNNDMYAACVEDSSNFGNVSKINDQIKEAFQRLAESMVTTYFVSGFGGTPDAPSKLAIRGSFTETDLQPKTLFTEIANESHLRITEEENVSFTPRKQLMNVPLGNLVIYQYEHTFNQASANAVPLFAAKALEYIQQSIEYQHAKNPKAQVKALSWENLLVGMNKQGFIEQGQSHVQLNKNIVHWLSAGSRAGKGVASYNLILPMLLEDRLFFYNDRKPDTSIVLAQQAGMKDGKPNIALVNGGQHGAVSKENEKFINWQEKAIQAHKPSWLNIKSRNVLDDFVYLRQCMVVFAVIYSMVNHSMEDILKELDLPNGFVTGISAVFDEFTNYQKSFLEGLDPFSSQGSLLKGVLNDDIWDLISDPESDAYKSVEKKNLLKNVTMENAWKVGIMNTLLAGQQFISTIARAGVQTFASQIDIMMIGQGFRGEKSKTIFDMPKGKNSGEYIKGQTFPSLNVNGAKDPLITLLQTLPGQDYMLGTPPEPEAGQNYDLIDINGKNSAVYGNYLNRNFRGFAYINRNAIQTGETSQGFIFKPFLLLNEGSETPNMKKMAKDGKMNMQQLEKDISQYKDQPGGYMAFLAQQVNNIDGTDWLTVRKELVDTLHLDKSGESLAGVIPYSKAIGFEKDKYQRTIVFMDAVVKKMGYDGSYQDFVCDMRPEWTIGIEDIDIALFEGLDAFHNRDSLNTLRSYVKSNQFDPDRDTVNKDIIGVSDNDGYGDPEDGFGNEDDDDVPEGTGDHFPDRNRGVPLPNPAGFGGTGADANSNPTGFNPSNPSNPAGGTDLDGFVPDSDNPNSGRIPGQSGAGVPNGLGKLPDDGSKPDYPDYPDDDSDPDYPDDDSDPDYPDDDDDNSEGGSYGHTHNDNPISPINSDNPFGNSEPTNPLGDGNSPQGTIPSTNLESPFSGDSNGNSNGDDNPNRTNPSGLQDNPTPETETPELREIKYLGLADARKGNLAYTSRKKISFNSDEQLAAYNQGYIEGYSTSPKQNKIYSLCTQTAIPEALETARLLGIPNSFDHDANLGGTNANGDSGFTGGRDLNRDQGDGGLDSMKDRVRNVFDSPIFRNIPVDLMNRINKATNNYFDEESVKTYGTNDSYIFNGKKGHLTNLDSALTSGYKKFRNQTTGKVDTDKSLQDYIQVVTQEIINKVGSYNQFHNIVVTDTGEMVVNEMFRVQFAVPTDVYESLPLGVRMIIDNGQWGKLFSWQEMKQMPNLYQVSFDSMQFVYSYVRPYFKSRRIDQSSLLRNLPQVYAISIQGDPITRDSLEPEDFWDNFRNRSNTRPNIFSNYNRQRFDSMRNKWKNRKPSKEYEEEAQRRRDKRYRDTAQPDSSEATSRMERNRLEKQARFRSSARDISDALSRHDMREALSDAKYCLRVIPGILTARKPDREPKHMARDY